MPLSPSDPSLVTVSIMGLHSDVVTTAEWQADETGAKERWMVTCWNDSGLWLLRPKPARCFWKRFPAATAGQPCAHMGLVTFCRVAFSTSFTLAAGVPFWVKGSGEQLCSVMKVIVQSFAAYSANCCHLMTTGCNSILHPIASVVEPGHINEEGKSNVVMQFAHATLI